MNLEQARINMVKQQLKACDVLDTRVLDAINAIPREDFVPEAYKNAAFVDMAIPLGHEEFMMKPREEGLILQALEIKETDTILEIGCGSGYFTALLAKLGKYVYSVDINGPFCAEAMSRLKHLGIHNVAVRQGDAAQGWEVDAPYDRIVITGSLPFLPKRFKEQVNQYGKIFAVVGKAPVMQAILLSEMDGSWREEVLFETFVPPLQNAVMKDTFVF